jgi:hypothetical protein
MNAIEQLKSVLCDPEGKCCIAGSDEDRAIVNRALQALAQRTEQKPVAWGWAIMHSDGTKASVRPRIVDFFGCIQEKEPFTSEDAKRADQEWAGLAPHTIVTLYTTPPQRT